MLDQVWFWLLQLFIFVEVFGVCLGSINVAWLMPIICCKKAIYSSLSLRSLAATAANSKCMSACSLSYCLIAHSANICSHFSTSAPSSRASFAACVASSIFPASRLNKANFNKTIG